MRKKWLQIPAMTKPSVTSNSCFPKSHEFIALTSVGASLTQYLQPGAEVMTWFKWTFAEAFFMRGLLEAVFLQRATGRSIPPFRRGDVWRRFVKYCHFNPDILIPQATISLTLQRTHTCDSCVLSFSLPAYVRTRTDPWVYEVMWAESSQSIFVLDFTSGTLRKTISLPGQS